MEYVSRTLEDKFTRMSSFFKAVLVTGARQVGKTTMLRHLSEGEERTYVTLDNLMARNLAQSDPALFFQTYKLPILIDEVQYAPELFNQIKLLCDESGETGRFWLTGSQQFSMMKNVQQTLAGQLGILELHSFTRNEIDGIVFDNEMDFSLACLQRRQAIAPKNDVIKTFEYIWRGGMPQVQRADEEQRQAYYDSYIDTYIMRDVTQLGGVTDALRFRKFITACAALVAERVNYKTIAETADVSQPTAKEWLSLLEGMGIVYLLRPYYNNALKRLAKTSKLYFYDTGLCAYLSMWLTPETLRNGAANGHYFENYVVSEMVKNYAYAKSRANLSYYRDANAKEIDLFVEENNLIHPLEIKLSANPDTREVKKFGVLDKAAIERGAGGILCMCQEVVPIDARNCFIPCNLI